MLIFVFRYVKILTIGYNCIGIPGAVAIAEALQTNNSITQLDISKNYC